MDDLKDQENLQDKGNSSIVLDLLSEICDPNSEPETDPSFEKNSSEKSVDCHSLQSENDLNIAIPVKNLESSNSKDKINISVVNLEEDLKEDESCSTMSEIGTSQDKLDTCNSTDGISIETLNEEVSVDDSSRLLKASENNVIQEHLNMVSDEAKGNLEDESCGTMSETGTSQDKLDTCNSTDGISIETLNEEVSVDDSSRLLKASENNVIQEHLNMVSDEAKGNLEDESCGTMSETGTSQDKLDTCNSTDGRSIETLNEEVSVDDSSRLLKASENNVIQEHLTMVSDEAKDNLEDESCGTLSETGTSQDKLDTCNSTDGRSIETLNEEASVDDGSRLLKASENNVIQEHLNMVSDEAKGNLEDLIEDESCGTMSETGTRQDKLDTCNSTDGRSIETLNEEVSVDDSSRLLKASENNVIQEHLTMVSDEAKDNLEDESCGTLSETGTSQDKLDTCNSTDGRSIETLNEEASVDDGSRLLKASENNVIQEHLNMVSDEAKGNLEDLIEDESCGTMSETGTRQDKLDTCNSTDGRSIETLNEEVSVDDSSRLLKASENNVIQEHLNKVSDETKGNLEDLVEDESCDTMSETGTSQDKLDTCNSTDGRSIETLNEEVSVDDSSRLLKASENNVIQEHLNKVSDETKGNLEDLVEDESCGTMSETGTSQDKLDTCNSTDGRSIETLNEEVSVDDSSRLLKASENNVIQEQLTMVTDEAKGNLEDLVEDESCGTMSETGTSQDKLDTCNSTDGLKIETLNEIIECITITDDSRLLEGSEKMNLESEETKSNSEATDEPHIEISVNKDMQLENPEVENLTADLNSESNVVKELENLISSYSDKKEFEILECENKKTHHESKVAVISDNVNILESCNLDDLEGGNMLKETSHSICLKDKTDSDGHTFSNSNKEQGSEEPVNFNKLVSSDVKQKEEIIVGDGTLQTDLDKTSLLIEDESKVSPITDPSKPTEEAIIISNKKNVVEESEKVSDALFELDDENLDGNSPNSIFSPKKKSQIKVTLNKLFYEKPGEDIKDGLFKRIVIVGDNFAASIVDFWPVESNIKPYFFCSNSLSTTKIFEAMKESHVFKDCDKVLMVVIPNLADIVIYKDLIKNCNHEHPNFKVLSSAIESNHVKEYIKKISEKKKHFESYHSHVTVIFSYFPLFTLLENMKTIFNEQMKQTQMFHECSCIFPDFLVREKSTYISYISNYRKAIEYFNKYLFANNWTNLNWNKCYRYFDFTPFCVNFKDNKWAATTESDKKINAFDLNRSLHLFLFGTNSKCQLAPSELYENYLEVRSKPRGLKIYFIGDEWVKAIYDSWPYDSFIKPFFCCDSSLNLEQLQERIISLTQKDENCWVICCLGIVNFTTYKEYPACFDHEPLKYPLPKQNITEKPLAFTTEIFKSICDLKKYISKRRANCRVGFSTSFPIFFSQIDDFLNRYHEKTTGHKSYNSLTSFERPKESILNAISALNLKLVELNGESDLHSCDVFDSCLKIKNHSNSICIPYYDPKSDVPSFVLVNELIGLIEGYIKSIEEKHIKGKLPYENNSYDTNFDESCAEKEAAKQNIILCDKPKALAKIKKSCVKKNSLQTCKDPKTDKKSLSGHKKNFATVCVTSSSSGREKKLKRSNQPTHETTHMSSTNAPTNYSYSSYYMPPTTYQAFQKSHWNVERNPAQNSYRYEGTIQPKDDYLTYKRPQYGYSYPTGVFKSDRSRSRDRLSRSRDRLSRDRLSRSRDRLSRDRLSRSRDRLSRSRSRDHRRSRSRSRDHRRSRSRSRDHHRSRSRSKGHHRSRSRRHRSRSKGHKSSRRSHYSPSYKKKSKKRKKRSSSDSSSDSSDNIQKKSRRSSKKERKLSSIKKSALENLWEIHRKECDTYRKNPSAHPEHRRLLQMWQNATATQGSDYSYYELHDEWSKYWKVKMETLFEESWQEKKQQCLNVLYSDSFDSDSSDSDVVKSKSKKRKRKKHKRNLSESLPAKKEEEPSSTVDDIQIKISQFMKNAKSMEIASSTPTSMKEPHFSVEEVTSVLSEMSDKFGALGVSVTLLHKSVMSSIANGDDPLKCLDEDARMLLSLVEGKIVKAINDKSLSVVQNAILQEALDRLGPFLKSLKKEVVDHKVDVDIIAKATMGQEIMDIVNFIKNALAYKQITDVTNNDIMQIYLAVKDKQLKLSSGKASTTVNEPRSSPQPVPGPSGISNNPINQMSQVKVKQSKYDQIKRNFMALPMADKIKKFTNFKQLSFEEKNFLLNHLDNLEKSDPQLALSLRWMMNKG